MATIASLMFVVISLGACLLLFFGLIYLLFDFVTNEIPSAYDWTKRWPPISDDEFIQRCQPGVDRDVALRVRKVVSEQLGIPYEQIYPEQNFVNDLGCL